MLIHHVHQVFLFFNTCPLFVLPWNKHVLQSSKVRPSTTTNFFVPLQQLSANVLCSCWAARWSSFPYPYIFALLNTLKAFINFEISNESAWSNFFLYVKVCVFWKFIQYTINWDKNKSWKSPVGQSKHYKKCNIFFFMNSNSSQFYFQLAILITVEAQSSSL